MNKLMPHEVKPGMLFKFTPNAGIAEKLVHYPVFVQEVRNWGIIGLVPYPIANAANLLDKTQPEITIFLSPVRVAWDLLGDQL